MYTVRRRTLLGALAGATTATAGCAQLSDTIDRAAEGSRIENLGPGHPWDGDRIALSTAFDESVDPRENFTELVESAVAFWEEHDQQYADVDVEYDLDPDADDPDVRVTLVSEIESCDRSEEEYRVVGCAPLITDHAPDTASVEILRGYSDELMETTITHELGHTLGLDHEDDPQEIMSNDPVDRLPNYETRRAINEAYVSASGSVKTANDHHSDANDDWDAERWSAATDAFGRAADEYAAAERSYSHAAEESESLELTDAKTICEAGQQVAATSASAAGAMGDAAAAQADGDRRTAQRHLDTANEHYDQLDDDGVPPSENLAVALGLQ